MKRVTILAVMLMAVLGVALYAQTQADVTVTITLKAADVSALKEAMLSQGSGGPAAGRMDSAYVDVVDGVSTMTDASVQKWAKQQVKQQMDTIIRQYADSAVRQQMPDLSTLTPDQRAALITYLKTLKK